MVKEALDAFVRGDEKLAIKVCEDDQFVDDLNEQIQRELLTFMMGDPSTISPGHQDQLHLEVPGADRRPCHQRCGDGDLHGQGEGHPAHHRLAPISRTR